MVQVNSWLMFGIAKGAFKYYVIALGGGGGPASIADDDDALRGSRTKMMT